MLRLRCRARFVLPPTGSANVLPVVVCHRWRFHSGPCHIQTDADRYWRGSADPT